MKIAINAGTLYPARRAWIYGSEVEAFLLAEELGKLGHTIYFYGAPGSEKSPYFNKFRYLPGGHGLIDISKEHFIVEYYADELLDVDVIIDMSPQLYTAEWAFFNNVPFIAVRNGMDITLPRLFRYRNLVVLSNVVVDHNKIPYTSVKIIPYGIDEDFYKIGRAHV